MAMEGVIRYNTELAIRRNRTYGTIWEKEEPESGAAGTAEISDAVTRMLMTKMRMFLYPISCGKSVRKKAEDGGMRTDSKGQRGQRRKNCRKNPGNFIPCKMVGSWLYQGFQYAVPERIEGEGE